MFTFAPPATSGQMPGGRAGLGRRGAGEGAASVRAAVWALPQWETPASALSFGRPPPGWASLGAPKPQPCAGESVALLQLGRGLDGSAGLGLDGAPAHAGRERTDEGVLPIRELTWTHL